MRSGLCMKKKKNHKTFRHPACRAVSSDRMRRGETEREPVLFADTGKTRSSKPRGTAHRTADENAQKQDPLELVGFTCSARTANHSPNAKPGAHAGRGGWGISSVALGSLFSCSFHAAPRLEPPIQGSKPLHTLLPGSLTASTCLAEALGAVRCPRVRDTRCVGPGISYFAVSALSGTCKSEDS